MYEIGQVLRANHDWVKRSFHRRVYSKDEDDPYELVHEGVVVKIDKAFKQTSYTLEMITPEWGKNHWGRNDPRVKYPQRSKIRHWNFFEKDLEPSEDVDIESCM